MKKTTSEPTRSAGSKRPVSDAKEAMVSRFASLATPGRPTVVAVRGLGIDGRRHVSHARGRLGDVMIVYPRRMAPMVVRASTVAWEANENGRMTDVPPGDYEAAPIAVDEEGRYDLRGRPIFALSEPHGQGVIVLGNRFASIYPESMAGPHVGCQLLSEDDWASFRRAVGDGDAGEKRASFRYVLVRNDRGA